LYAFDPVPERLAAVGAAQGVLPCASVAEGLAQQPTLALVCTPPHLHLALAQQALAANAHVFIEKPLANELGGMAELLNEARRQHRVLYVGYNLRFHAGLIKLKSLLDEGVIGKLLMIRAEVGQYLPDWRPTQDYRQGYNVSAAMGGGIILDASHELDYVRWLGGEVQRVFCAAGQLSDLEMETEDAAAIVLQLANGVIAEVHLDCIQRGYARSCKLIGAQGTLTWDFKEGVRWFDGATNAWQEFKIAPDPNEMYVEELRHVLACVRGEVAPLVDGAQGKRVLEIALAAKRSAQLKQVIDL
jgi:predicted dehydrogenase